MRLPVLINEKISLLDIIFKYVLRDSLLGIIRAIPAAPGVAIRMLIYKLFFKKCGKGLRVADYVVIKFPEMIAVGNHVAFNEFDWIDGNGGIEIGDYVRIGPHVSVISFEHVFSDPEIPIKLQGKSLKKIVIEDDVWIGAGSKILGGVTIGKGSVIGAGSVVTKNIPPYSIAVGNPARIIRKRGC